MLLAALVSAGHFLALGLGFYGVTERWKSLRRLAAEPTNARLLKDVYLADAHWGVAALLWIGTGLARSFGGIEKAPAFYTRNGFFHLKLTLFVVVFLIEIAPMVGLIRWRMAGKKDPAFVPDPGSARSWARASFVELLLLLAILLVAPFMARGAWMF